MRCWSRRAWNAFMPKARVWDFMRHLFAKKRHYICEIFIVFFKKTAILIMDPCFREVQKALIKIAGPLHNEDAIYPIAAFRRLCGVFGAHHGLYELQCLLR